MTKKLTSFFAKEDGAVTVDWVVLCAAIVGLAAVAYVSIEEQALLLRDKAAGDIQAELAR